MKRTIPLFITAAGGFVLILSTFIPMTESWGEVASVWFDLLAAIAFILGGGNLVKMHLKKISDQKKGWGYSMITIVAFLAMLVAGLFKIGSTPAVDQEFFGESFVPMTVEELPDSLTFSLPGTIYERKDGEGLPHSVRRQMSQNGNKVEFRGWMQSSQKSDLMKYEDTLEWQALVENLYDLSQPGKKDSNSKKSDKTAKTKKEKTKKKITLKGKVAYYANHQSLSFKGYMTEEHKQLLLALDDTSTWQEKIEELAKKARKKTEINLREIPQRFQLEVNEQTYLSLDKTTKKLTLLGPMTASLRDKLARRPYLTSKSLSVEKRAQFLKRLEARGAPFTEDQRKAFHNVLNGTWTLDQLRHDLSAAGFPEEIEKTSNVLLSEKKTGIKILKNKKKVGKHVVFNDTQNALLASFVDDDAMTFRELKKKLKKAGDLSDGQEGILDKFRENNSTVGERNRQIYFEILKVGAVSEEQKEELLAEYRQADSWRRSMGELYFASHSVKYPWSGIYRHQGNPFWWLYEYGFKPLTATMFAMLAFYVASAAFRAFRAKNLEATLLLLTAFIILLGRTFAGVYITDSLAADSEFRIEKISVTILQVFNTAGNRAIMIGIALGLASTSLKVLLGVDRSYLGSGEE